MKVAYYVRDIDFMQALGGTNHCITHSRTDTGFLKIIILKGEDPVTLSPMHAYHSSRTTLTLTSIPVSFRGDPIAFYEIFFFE